MFTNGKTFSDLRMPVEVPCGQCVGCRLERSRQWAIRCVHEASLHENNTFITLTYKTEKIPAGWTLDLRDFQLFMKRLRKKYGAGIRFFHCGEYGEKHARPHYHACLFGHEFSDKKYHKTENGHKLYTSKELTELWPNGYHLIGALTFQSAAYVARYIMKKVTGKDAESHYDGRAPEYITMSRRPGIAQGWLDRFTTDVYPDDFIVINGKKMRPPRYYDRQYEITNYCDFEIIKKKRKLKAEENKENNTSERLRVRELVKTKSIQQLKRPLQ